MEVVDPHVVAGTGLAATFPVLRDATVALCSLSPSCETTLASLVARRQRESQRAPFMSEPEFWDYSVQLLSALQSVSTVFC